MTTKIILFVFSFILLGCEQDNSRLENKIVELASSTKSLETKIQTLELQVSLLSNPTKGHVVLDPGSKNYQLVETNVGPLFVVFKDVKPYLNGQKLRIAFGNPLLTTYNGAELKFKWGETINYDKPNYNFTEWSKTLQEKTVKIPNTLTPGSWNEIEVIITPATPEQLGYLSLTITLDQVSLHP